MKIFLDTANLDELKKGAAWGIVDGVTTNPSLIAKEGKPIEEQVAAICDIVDGDISAEVVSTTAKEMVEEGRKLAKIHKNIVVKLPLIRDGIQACKELSKDGIRTNVTLCFTAPQAMLAAKAGAYIISPFVGRLDDIALQGMELIESIHSILGNSSTVNAGSTSRFGPNVPNTKSIPQRLENTGSVNIVNPSILIRHVACPIHATCTPVSGHNCGFGLCGAARTGSNISFAYCLQKIGACR